MPDICDLILDDHERFRRWFADLDEHRDADAATLRGIWQPLADLLDLHAVAEEELFYPELLKLGKNADEETDDAIGDHNDIRDAAHAAGGQEVGSTAWWESVLKAREENSTHMGEEEREALPDFRTHADQALRESLGAKWLAYKEKHADLSGVDTSDKDPQSYIEQNS